MLRCCSPSIHKAVAGTPVEVIFVDHFTDEPPLSVGHYPELNVRLFHRSPSAAAPAGWVGLCDRALKAAQSEYACVMDGDLQHPPELLPVTLKKYSLDQKVDLVVGTRRAENSKGGRSERPLVFRFRGRWISPPASFSRANCTVGDPLAGFFLVRVKALDLGALRPNGF